MLAGGCLGRASDEAAEASVWIAWSMRCGASAATTTAAFGVAAAAGCLATSRNRWCGLALAAARTWLAAVPVVMITPQCRWTRVSSMTVALPGPLSGR